jgi:cobalt/nickel transport system permease protein
MANLESTWNNLKAFDELAAQKTPVHLLHPCAKLLVTLVYITVVASFGKYDLTALLPLVLYPVVLISLGQLPAGYLCKRLLLAIPFVCFVGIFNPWFDSTPLLQFGKIIITGGWISFLSILLRVALTVLAALILVATSGLNEIAAALLAVKIPRIFVMQLLFVYRYLSVLLEETARILRAHSLRSQDAAVQGLGYKVWGSLVGQLLLRTMNRAERIYQAMLCRGFTGEVYWRKPRKMGWKDLLYCLGWTVFFGLARLYNIPLGIGTILMGVGK